MTEEKSGGRNGPKTLDLARDFFSQNLMTFDSTKTRLFRPHQYQLSHKHSWVSSILWRVFGMSIIDDESESLLGAVSAFWSFFDDTF